MARRKRPSIDSRQVTGFDIPHTSRPALKSGESEDDLSDIDIETINGDEPPPVKILAAKRDVLAEDFLQVKVQEISQKNAHLENKLHVINPSDDENEVLDTDSECDEGNALVFYTTTNSDALDEPSLDMEVTEEPVSIKEEVKEELDEELDPDPVQQTIEEAWTENRQHDGAQLTCSGTCNDKSVKGNYKQEQVMAEPEMGNSAEKLISLLDNPAITANQVSKECTLCGIMFQADALKWHQRNKPHYNVWASTKRATHRTWNKCGYCHVIFSHHVDELTHFASFHKGLSPQVEKATAFYSCSICPLSFGNVSCWLNHVKNHSVSNVVHKCHVCRKTFATQMKLLLHVDSHPAGEEHKCRYCDARFALELTLMNHYSLKHLITMHPCSKCGEKFLSNEELTRHVDNQHPVNVFGTVTAYDDTANARPALPLALKSVTGRTNMPSTYAPCDRLSLSTPVRSLLPKNRLETDNDTPQSRALKSAVLPQWLRPISPPMISTQGPHEKPPELSSKSERTSPEVVRPTSNDRFQVPVNCLISLTGETVQLLGTAPHSCASANKTPHRRTANASAFYEKVHGVSLLTKLGGEVPSRRSGESSEKSVNAECRAQENVSKSAKMVSILARGHTSGNLDSTTVRVKVEPPDYDEESTETDNDFTETALEEKPFIIKEEIADELPTVVDEINASERVSQGPICCAFCAGMFDSPDRVKIHISSGECRVRKLARTASEYKYRLECDVCGARLQNKATLSIHVLLHSPCTECRLCLERFATRRKLSSHYTTHFDLGYRCTFCSKTFATSFEKTQHSRRMHSLERIMDKTDGKRTLEEIDHDQETDQTYRISPSLSSSKRAKLSECDSDSIGNSSDGNDMDLDDGWDGESMMAKNDRVDQCSVDHFKSNHSQECEEARSPPKTQFETPLPGYEVFRNEDSESENPDIV